MEGTVTLNLQHKHFFLTLYYTHTHTRTHTPTLPTSYCYTSSYIMHTIAHTKPIYLLCHGICLLLVLCGSLVRLPHLRHEIVHRPTQKPGEEVEGAQ